jgi:hypothetical protein
VGRNFIQFGDARTEIGRAIGEWYVLKTDGIFQNQAEIDAHRVQPWAKPGDIRYVDVDKDGTLNTDRDRTYVGSPWPSLQAGLIWNASYKNFTFSMQWYGVFGNKLYNRPRWWTDRFDENANYRSSIQPWTTANPSTEVPRIGFNGAIDQGIQFNAFPQTDRWLESGTYVRLRNLQIGYALPTALLTRIGFQSASVYISGQNLLTFTGYTWRASTYSSGAWTMANTRLCGSIRWVCSLGSSVTSFPVNNHLHEKDTHIYIIGRTAQRDGRL